jgi:hypothetical protein
VPRDSLKEVGRKRDPTVKVRRVLFGLLRGTELKNRILVKEGKLGCRKLGCRKLVSHARYWKLSHTGYSKGNRGILYRILCGILYGMKEMHPI